MKKNKSPKMTSARKFAEGDSSANRVPYLKLPPDTKLYRFDSKKDKYLDLLAYKVGKGNPEAEKGTLYVSRRFFIHRNVGPKNLSVICPAKTCGKKCPVCEERQKCWDDGDDDAAAEFRPSERALWALIDTKNRDDGIQIFDIADFHFGTQVTAAINSIKKDDDPRLQFYSLTDGYTLCVQIKQEKFNNKPVFKAERIDFVERKKQYKAKKYKEAPCLDKLLKILSYDEISAMLNAEDGDDNDESSSKRKKKNKKKKKKGRK